MTKEEAIELVKNDLQKENLHNLETGDIIEENFGWVIMLLLKTDEFIIGGPSCCFVNSVTQELWYSSIYYLEMNITHYQEQHGFPKGMTGDYENIYKHEKKSDSLWDYFMETLKAFSPKF